MQRIPALTAALVITAAIPAAPAGGQGRAQSRHRVEQASIVAVATLISTQELTASGVDYGFGLLRVERALYPPGPRPDRLLLRWDHATGTRRARLDLRVHEGRRSLWLLRLDPDGAACLVDRESVLPLSEADEVDRFVADLRPLTGGAYDDKVLAIERFVDSHSADPDGGDTEPPPRPVPVVDELMDFALRDYEAYLDFKAFAIAIDSTGRWVYGYTEELPDETLAAERALAECSMRAARNRVNAACRLYATGDRIVWDERE